MADKHDGDWWRGAVIYQIYPRSFCDSNGDGIGDLPGVTSRLDYIAALGVDAIWISPFFTSPMKDMGYDVSNYRDVDPSFGALSDFDALMARAHSLGLKVMIDLVLSHTSDQHPWFAQSRKSRDNAKADWYVWADPQADGTPPNNWLSIFGGSAWAWDSRRRQYYLHNFLVEQPDLNFHNPEVRAELLDVVKFWLDRGVDGFRLDTVNFYFHDQLLRSNPPSTLREAPDVPASNPYVFQNHIYDKTRPENLEFLKAFRALLNQYPGRTSVGEVGASERGLEVMGEYTAGGDKLHMCYAFDLLNDAFSASYIRKRLEVYEQVVVDGWGCWAFSNHDVMRAVSRWRFEDVAEQAAPLLLALQMSLRGSICIYEGEELALPEAEIAFEDLQDPYGRTFWPDFKGRDGCRTPMPWDDTPGAGFTTGKPWLPIPAIHRERSAARQEARPNSPLHRVRALLAWRRNLPELKDGAMRFLDTSDPVLAFTRSRDGRSVLCVFNLGREARSFDASAFSGATPLEGHGFDARLVGGRVELPPLSAFFARV